MLKPTIGELVVSGFRVGFSRNALIGTALVMLTLVLVPASFFVLGVVELPKGQAKMGIGMLWQFAILMFVTFFGAALVFQPFAIGMVEHVFRRPSPNTTWVVFARHLWASFIITLMFLPPMLVGYALVGAAGVLGLLLAPVIFIVSTYFQLGFALIWPFAVYAERFSIFEAYRAMSGNRIRVLLAQFLIVFPLVLLMTLLNLGTHNAIQEQAAWLSLLLFIPFLLMGGIVGCACLGAATRLYLWHRDQPAAQPYHPGGF